MSSNLNACTAASHNAVMNINMLYYASFTYSFIDICLAAVAAREEQQYHLLKMRDISIYKTNKQKTSQTKKQPPRTPQTNKKPKTTNKPEIS